MLNFHILDLGTVTKTKLPDPHSSRRTPILTAFDGDILNSGGVKRVNYPVFTRLGLNTANNANDAGSYSMFTNPKQAVMNLNLKHVLRGA